MESGIYSQPNCRTLNLKFLQLPLEKHAGFAGLYLGILLPMNNTVCACEVSRRIIKTRYVVAYDHGWTDHEPKTSAGILAEPESAYISSGRNNALERGL